MPRARHRGLARRHIHLHGLGGVHIGGIGDGHAHTGGVGAGLLRLDAGKLEGGVAQAVAERIIDRLAIRVVIAVAHEHALTVIDMSFLARPVDHARIVVDAHRDALRQLAGRACLAEDHIGERGTPRLTEQPGFEDALGIGRPWGHGDDGTVGKHDRDVLVRRRDSFEQLDLLGGNVEGFTVEAFGFGGFRKS